MKILLLILLLANCASAHIEPKKLDLEKNCDSDKMALPSNLPDEGWIKVKDARTVEKANAKCGRHAIETAQYNFHAAEKNKPESGFLAALKVGIVAFVFGFGIGAGK